MTAAQKTLLFFISVYQKLCRPAMAPRCRFLPTCSNYARQAVERRGALTGAALSLLRLLRCHPLCAGGLDPVPETTPRSACHGNG